MTQGDTRADLDLLQAESWRYTNEYNQADPDYAAAGRNITRMLRDLDKTQVSGPSNMFSGPGD